MPSRMFVFLAAVYEVVSILSELSVICSMWKKSIEWLEFELFKLMVPVTVFGVRSYVPTSPHPTPVVSLPMV